MTIAEALKKVRPKLFKRINNAMENEVFETVREVESQAVHDVVYSMPTSGRYTRRRNNEGLSDKENMVIEGGKAKYGRIKVINITEPNEYLNGVDGDKATTDKYLAYLVEYGVPQDGDSGYDFWKKPKERRFTERTREDLVQGQKHVEAMRKGLERNGLKVE